MGALLLGLAGFAAARIWIKPRTARDMKRRSHPFETAPNSMQMFRPHDGEDGDRWDGERPRPPDR